MAKFSSYKNGQFSWIDLMATDMAEIAGFYEGMFGWELDRQDTQGGPPYGIFRLGDSKIAGLGQMPDDMKASGRPPAWNSYINVDDLDATLAKATELGATVVMPAMKVMDAGSMAVIQDPQGAFVSLWQKDRHYGADLTNIPNTWVWNELLCQDTTAAAEFYNGLFGWEAKLEPDSDPQYWGFELNERMNGGMLALQPEMGPIPPYWGMYIAVEDAAAAAEKVAKLGGNLLRPVFQTGVGHIAICQDPQGAVFSAIQLTVPADD